jgi:hypothetical protein
VVEQYGRWSIGLLSSGLTYPLRRVPMYRRNQHVTDTDLLDPDRDLVGDPATLQRSSAGSGVLFHRSYRLRVADAELGPDELITRIAADPQAIMPNTMAHFELPDGGKVERLELGDELVVRLPGPWDGPVRVIERTPTSFRFATLQGHMEAGEIEFSASYDDRGFLCFAIESWARAATRTFGWIYERVPVAREMQLHLWAQVCGNAADLAGGIRMTNVVATTRVIEVA